MPYITLPPTTVPTGNWTAESLEVAQATAVSAMIDTAEVLRSSGTRDDDGSRYASTSVVHTYPCRVLHARSSSEGVQAGEITARTTFDIQLPVPADVTPADRLRVNGVNVYEVRDTILVTQAIVLIAVCVLVRSDTAS